MAAKLSTPRVEHVLLRQRLFKSLDKARIQNLVWVNAPAGAGKTTLLASYLANRQLQHIWFQLDESDADPASFFYHLSQAAEVISPSDTPLPLLTAEYLTGISIYTRNFFRELFKRFSAPAVLVLDNYQDVPDDALLHGLLATAMKDTPRDVSIVIISREKPLAPYARLQAHGDIQIIDWEQIKFTKAETADVIAMRTGSTAESDVVEDLYLRTDGWITGLILLLEHAETPSKADTPLLGEQGLLFEYFAGEIFDHSDSQVQKFLLATALLPKFTLAMAESFLNHKDSRRIINKLLEKNYFIYSHQHNPVTYEYHPLFKEFLRSFGMSRLGMTERTALHESAMNLLVKSGEPEAAIALAKETENWSAIIELITRNAADLAQHGRYSTLREWLSCLPDSVIKTNSWLSYWQGVTLIFENPLAARAILTGAYRDFGATQDNIGRALAWSSIIDTYLVSWSEFISLDQWLDELEQQAETIETSLPLEIQARFTAAVFIALLYRRPANKSMPAWADKVWNLFIHTDSSQLRLYLGTHLLMYFMWWVGDLAKAKTLLDTLTIRTKDADIDPFHNLLLHAIEAALSWMSAENRHAMEAADEGLLLAANTGIHSWDIFITAQAAFGALSENNMAKTAEYLASMKLKMAPTRYVDSAWYSYIQSWYQYQLGDKKQALAYLQQACELSDKSGIHYFIGVVYNELGRLQAELGDMEQGLSIIEHVLDTGQKMHSATLQYLAWLSKAELYDSSHNKEQTLFALQQAFAFGREYQIYNHAWWRDINMKNLYRLALKHDIEPDYIKTIIRKRHLLPGSDAANLENWPWPIKIYTMGRFSLVIDDKPFDFGNKTQKKPLELLKVLIALGGREICEASLAQSLWPDTEGDLARQNLKMNIHRLRKMLQHDAVFWIDGKLTLNPQLCWIDVWDIERQMNALLEHLPSSTTELKKRVDKALSIYHGPFLHGEEHPSILGLRERLRSKLLRLLTQTAEQLFINNEYASAIRYYQQGLELEILAEGFYQGLMRCYLQLGQYAEGLAIYQHCRTVLRTTLNIEPSTETTTLAHTILASSR